MEYAKNPYRCRSLAAVYLAFAVSLLPDTGYASSTTTVALTTTARDAATADERQLTENLLSLMEVEAGRHEQLQVVERQQLDLALHELVLSGSQSDAAKLRLGKLAGADLILTAKLLEPDDSGTRNMHVRVTESETAVVQGETLVPISAAGVEDSATEIVDFLAHMAQKDNRQAATIAVLPFESVERFDRLRPLERGLRDLFTSYFLRQGNFRVVQRTSMEQLLNELELVRTGFTREGRGLEAAPTREATYVLRGEIDERTAAEGNLVVIRAELVDAQSRRVIATSERATEPEDVPAAVTAMAEELAAVIANGVKREPKQRPKAGKEVDRLYELAIHDVYRFVRYSPDDAGYTPFHIPGTDWPRNVLPEADPNSPLGVALLQKSVDRLESVLFIEPERLKAALPLAYCLSFHVDGVWRPEQCEALLRRVRDESQDPAMQEVAIRLLGDMYFPHEGCLYSEQHVVKLDPELAQLGFERRLEAFAAMSDIGLGGEQPSLLNMLEKLCECGEGDARWSAVLEALAKAIHEPKTPHANSEVTDNLARQASDLAAQVVRSKKTSAPLKQQAEQLLRKWAESDNRWQWLHAARQLIILRLNEAEYDDFDAKLDAHFGDAATPFDQQTLTEQKTWLAIRLRNEGKIDKALVVLKSFEPKNQTRALGYDFTYCHYGYWLGRCYEDLGRKQEALEAYLHYAEMPSGYHAGHDFLQRIDALGGVPLKPDREIDVKYAEWSASQPLFCRVLATDGRRLFCAGGFEDDRYGPQAEGIPSVRQLNLETGDWTTLGGPDDRVSCLTVADGRLWAGTDHQGLWCLELSNGKWRQRTTADGLPTDSVVAVEAKGTTAYASVGNINPNHEVVSGGLVRVQDEDTHIYRDAAAPLTAPVSMAIKDGQLIAAGVENRLHALDLASDKWSAPTDVYSNVVAAGSSGLWTAPYRAIAALVDADLKPVQRFPAKPRLVDYPAGMYLPECFVEHEGSLWICGRPWRRFGDSGLFRLDLETGKLMRYGPRDGFRYADDNHYRCYAAVWAADRLWVATSFGLASVALRERGED